MQASQRQRYGVTAGLEITHRTHARTPLTRGVCPTRATPYATGERENIRC
jgi:hypothetical protein